MLHRQRADSVRSSAATRANDLAQALSRSRPRPAIEYAAVSNEDASKLCGKGRVDEQTPPAVKPYAKREGVNGCASVGTWADDGRRRGGERVRVTRRPLVRLLADVPLEWCNLRPGAREGPKRDVQWRARILQ